MSRCRRPGRTIAASCLMLALSCDVLGSVAGERPATVPESGSAVLSDLNRVGEATLRVLFWDIYVSKLYTRDGSFQGVQPGMALNLKYKRAVTDEQLVQATRKQWQKLPGFQPETSEMWLAKLLELWPDVAAGDEILLYVDEQLASHFYFNGGRLGVMTDPRFTQQFLAIWLSPQTSYPEVRAQLIAASRDGTR